MTTMYPVRRMRRALQSGLAAVTLCICAVAVQAQSVARTWNEEALDAIRIDFPHPPVHARNLFHLSTAMWDAWAAYDAHAVGYVYNQKATWTNVVQARDEAVSYAAYRLLKYRYALSVNSTQTLNDLAATLTSLGYDTNNISLVGDTPAAVGNRAAQAIIDYAIDDGTNETNDYEDASYSAINDPMILALPFDPADLVDPNRWQPLAFDYALTQNGLEADKVQSFLGPQWWTVRPFALYRDSPTNAYYDPGPPPFLYSTNEHIFKSNNLEVIRFSSYLDPDDNVMIDISPGGPGKNNPLGTYDGTGHPTNPVTGLPYETNLVNRADYGRLIAEIWADGPQSETPPGHWNTLANEVSDYPGFTRQFEGVGPSLDELEWDIKMYFALNAAQHDAATAAWTLKRIYDYIRPISTIRFLCNNGQCSDPLQPSFHTKGIPLLTNVIEVITTNSTASGKHHEHLVGHEGKIAINAWPGEPADPTNDYSGTVWFLGTQWKPYQRATFVTPAFPGYISGHSTFSRAGAEVLTRITGDEFFPGGMGVYTAAADSLIFEAGPESNVVLQWGTYYDAADEAGISRLYGGIHVRVDDLPGRIVGSQVGNSAFDMAKMYFDGTITNEPVDCLIASGGSGGDVMIEWDQLRAMQYRIATSSNLLQGFSTSSDYSQAKELIGSMIVSNAADQLFFRIDRVH